MSRWFRWHHGTTEDGKFRVAARYANVTGELRSVTERYATVTVRDVIALWAFILEDAAHDDHRGICHRSIDFMSAVLDFDDGVVERILGALDSTGLISRGNGEIFVTNWNKRQYESDKTDATAAERMRRYRAKKSAGDVKEAPVIGKKDPLRSRYGRVTAELRPDTDTELLSSNEDNKPREPTAREILLECLSEKTVTDLIAHRQAKRAKMTPRAARELVKAFTVYGDAEAAAAEMILRGWTGFKADWMVQATSPPGSNVTALGAGKPRERDLRNVPDALLSADDYWKKRRQQREWA